MVKCLVKVVMLKVLPEPVDPYDFIPPALQSTPQWKMI